VTKIKLTTLLAECLP